MCDEIIETYLVNQDMFWLGPSLLLQLSVNVLTAVNLF